MLNRKGQNTAEYAILIALVIAAAIGIQTYVKRGIQGRVRDSSDDFIEKLSTLEEWSDISSATATAEKQFEPTELSRQATGDVLEDKVVYTKDKAGTVSREITQRTQQAAGDYQQYDY